MTQGLVTRLCWTLLRTHFGPNHRSTNDIAGPKVKCMHLAKLQTSSSL